MSPRHSSLAAWLAWQEQLHPVGIDLGLTRVREVAQRLDLLRPAPIVFTVGGTNGKGSSVAFLEAMLRAAGRRTGVYVSPHLLRYEERVRLDGREATAEAFCSAFAAIDAARGNISLTYFEFGTLAALWLIRQARVDVAVLEVGLGGRLDAVNIVDADASLVTAIGIDHVEYLGPDRDSIGFEKAGIYRSGHVAVCADDDPPARLLGHAAAIAARLQVAGRDFHWQRETAASWSWRTASEALQGLPSPALIGTHQFANAAGVIALLRAFDPALVPESALHAGLRSARVAGRFQVQSGRVEWIFDVTHNPHGAAALAAALAARPCAGRTWLLLAMLADKDAAGFVAVLGDEVDGICCAGLSGARGRSARALAGVLGKTAILECHDVASACDALASLARPADRVLVTGSFHTVAQALQARSMIETA